jgi:hypothetical protein
MPEFQMPTPKQPRTQEKPRLMDHDEIVEVLESYKTEAEEHRRAGSNPRDDKWRENLDLYWGRYDFSQKASWQAQEVMPEVAAHVDRFAAALKEALVASPDDFFAVVDPADVEHDMTDVVKRVLNALLSIAGKNQNGAPLAFPTVFEEQVKLGALMATCSTVLWKDDVQGGRVAIETVDPRDVWLDPTFRNLYRIRRIELDWHDLKTLTRLKDGSGKPLFHLDAIDMLIASVNHEMSKNKEEATGGSMQQKSLRRVVVLDEYLATVVSKDGQVVHENKLFVVANGKFLIRGPEKNPFWHERDWLLFAPMVRVPFSVYGRSYMEDFGSVAKTFNELTNMILDAVYVSSMKVFAIVPDMLKNPSQAASGIQPLKTFLLEDGADARQFMNAVELGQVPSDSIRVWEAMKNELREAAGINEIGLGQFAPRARTTATEVTEASGNSSAFVRSVAETVETTWLNPTLDMTWKTGLQRIPNNHPTLPSVIGAEWWELFQDRGFRKELVARPMTFQARGISTMIQKSRVLRSLLGLLQIVAANELLLQEFLRVVDMGQLVRVLFTLSDIDLSRLQGSAREAMVRQVTEQMPQPAGGPRGDPETQRMAQDTAGMIGAM